MSIAISEDHRALAATATDFLVRHDSLAANRALLEADDEGRPELWRDLAALGWLGLHLPEDVGGSGYTLSEQVVVVERMGWGVCPGPYVPTVVASATIARAGTSEAPRRHLRGLADGSRTAGFGLEGQLTLESGTVSGTAPAVLGATGDLLVLRAGPDAILVERSASGVAVEVPRNVDPSRRCGRVVLDGAPAEVIAGGARALVDVARLVLAAEATGVARRSTEMAAAYAKERVQFGRPIATFQAVKHHCADMLVATELATAAVWEAARRAGEEDPFSFTAANAAVLALDAAGLCAALDIQVHGGIGFTWEHDAHLFLRRAAALSAVLNCDEAADDAVRLARTGRSRARLELPPEAEPMRAEVRQLVERVRDLAPADQRKELIDSGYALPHWPKPWGRDAGAVEQLVIEEELSKAGIRRPDYGITGWVILTLVQHAGPDQIARWVRPALDQEVIWCQLFSEPDAGSDAAGVKTRGRRVEGGWLVNGQKVWTSGAHVASWGLATIRTDPEAPKHQGITTMVIDMKAEGVTVRPLRQLTGNSDFNEVFLNDVFVADDDVVGPVNGGWTVARATLGNESVSIGGGAGGLMVGADAVLGALDGRTNTPPGMEARIGRYIARAEATALLNLRRVHRAVEGDGPGPEGNVTKLVLSELGHESAAIFAALAGPDAAYLEGPGAAAAMLVLSNRALSIAGGTSEIKRNQIGERILGLPRDPLLS